MNDKINISEEKLIEKSCSRFKQKKRNLSLLLYLLFTNSNQVLILFFFFVFFNLFICFFIFYYFFFCYFKAIEISSQQISMTFFNLVNLILTHHLSVGNVAMFLIRTFFFLFWTDYCCNASLVYFMFNSFFFFLAQLSTVWKKNFDVNSFDFVSDLSSLEAGKVTTSTSWDQFTKVFRSILFRLIQ